MPSQETTDLLSAIETPAGRSVSDLHSDARSTVATVADVVREMDRLEQLIEEAEFAETDDSIRGKLPRLNQKVQRAKADAEEARRLLRRSGQAIREIEDARVKLRDAVDAASGS